MRTLEEAVGVASARALHTARERAIAAALVVSTGGAD